MWSQTRVTERLGIKYPVIQAGMAGGSTTPQLVAAVSNSGGLGTLGAGYMTPEQIRQAVRAIRELTSKPFSVNLFLPEVYEHPDSLIDAMNERFAVYRKQVGIDEPPVLGKYAESFEEQLTVLIEEKVSIFSCTFGIPDEAVMGKLKQHGILVMGTATTVQEAIRLEQAGVDMIVGQGSEAGGHRGTFACDAAQAMIGTLALIPQIVDQVSVPVIAAGGIMDGRGVVAALALGAAGAQLGTAFLTCEESGANELHKAAILEATEDSTAITLAFSGKAARGILNTFMREMETVETPPYPIQNALTQDIRRAAAKSGNPELLSLWAGQGVRLSVRTNANELMQRLVHQVEHTLRKL